MFYFIIDTRGILSQIAMTEGYIQIHAFKILIFFNFDFFNAENSPLINTISTG
jgi:hypothetical protein